MRRRESEQEPTVYWQSPVDNLEDFDLLETQIADWFH